jgi:phosphoenolpyruvate carboxylase
MDEKAIQEAIEKAIAPMTEKVTELQKSVEEMKEANEKASTDFGERLEKVEKNAPKKVSDEEHIEKDEEVKNAIWTS